MARVCVAMTVALLPLVGCAASAPSGTLHYSATAHFPAGIEPTKGSEVRIGGVQAGSVASVGPEGRGWVAHLEIEPEFAPLAPHTRAILRNKTLLGETYIELAPGDP